ncbi:MAG: hypothetical protein IJ733_06110, partial [Lachnospiraceae bacterium]|nr:hypothetical protein [Lachnospiraceae bacterium]
KEFLSIALTSAFVITGANVSGGPAQQAKAADETVAIKKFTYNVTVADAPEAAKIKFGYIDNGAAGWNQGTKAEDAADGTRDYELTVSESATEVYSLGWIEGTAGMKVTLNSFTINGTYQFTLKEEKSVTLADGTSLAIGDTLTEASPFDSTAYVNADGASLEAVAGNNNDGKKTIVVKPAAAGTDASATPAASADASATPAASADASATPAASADASATPAASADASATPAASADASATPAASADASATPSATATPTASAAPSATATPSASAAPSATATPTASAAPSATATPTASAAPSETAAASAAPTASAAPAKSPEVSPSPSPSASASTSKKNPCKKVTVAKKSKSVTIKRGKTVPLTFILKNTTASKKTTDRITVKSSDKKKLVTAKVGKKAAKKVIVNVTVNKKAKKGSKVTITLKVGKRSAKATVKVK